MLSTQTQHTAPGGMIGCPIQWITCHRSSGRCTIRMFGQHRIGSMAQWHSPSRIYYHDLSSIPYTYIIATFYYYIGCRFWHDSF